MRKRLTYYSIVLNFCLCSATLAQIRFEPGYFIANDGLRTDCQIRNVDWKNNPLAFKFMRPGSDAIESGTIASIKEFGILEGPVYRRFEVMIDKSTEELDALSSSRNPEFVLDTLFLKVLVQGKARLYQYERKLLRFFYSVDQDTAQQLVYKMYQMPDGKVARNETYKQQVVSYLKCECLSENNGPFILVNRQNKLRFNTNPLRHFLSEILIEGVERTCKLK